MSTDRWSRLSDWHNAWLKGDSAERRRLRDELTFGSPDLVAEADALVAASLSMTGFLETPAFVLTAAQLASDEAAMKPGTLVGPYQITTLIARGGVGIVYRATDTRLDRQVALKTLASLGVPDELCVERFLREARITASLDHPNIVKVFDVGTHDGQPFMVVELLEGETLRKRLDRGPVAESDVRCIGIDIARGLVAAHAAGLVHRDLKPENVFLTRAGIAKILDFGIAKLAPEAVRRDSGASTLTGILLGTAGYLAPEQIQGREVDGRADLFALGSILFEMLTGQRAFARENTVDTLHAIVHDAPPDLLRDCADVSTSMETIVSRLLRKAPEDRFQTAADLVWALEQPSTHVERVRARIEPAAAGSTPRVRALPWIGALAASVLIALTWWAWSMGRRSGVTPNTEVARFNWMLPPDTGLWSAPVVSPDGRRIVWAGVSEAGSQLYVRELSSVEPHVLSGTTAARHPFWSPDGRWIGYFARGKLRKIAATGGPVTDIAAAPDFRGGTWSPAGVIVFQPNYRDAPLLRVSDQGGPTQPVTTVDLKVGDVSHRWPSFLPDGRHFLYFGLSVDDGRRGVYVGSLDELAAQPARPLFLSDSGAIYAPGPSRSEGLLLSAQGGRIEVRPFDAGRLMVTGDARALETNATPATPHHPALMSASATVLAYTAGVIPWGNRIARIDRDGSNLRVERDNQLTGAPRVSPDGRFLARHQVDAVRSNPDIWVDDLERGSTLRLTTSADNDVTPVWSPDGTQVAYRAGTLDKPTIGFAPSDGSGVKRTMACPKSPCEPSDWSPDGRFLLLTVDRTDVWTMPVGSEGQAQPLLAESFTERDARISPDGRWLAYVSDETGQPEVSVRSLTGPTRRFVVSSGGGDQPVWRRDGTELFFAGPEGRLFAVAVRPGPNAGLSFGTATKLNVPPLGERHQNTIYDVSLDGRIVYFQAQTDQILPREFGIVLGWRALIK
ncbi:MAG TPA: protein kinase [Vicinamibacterales bacterium]|nr:protein kinase [Vicinamibacterales bacterium]